MDKFTNEFYIGSRTCECNPSDDVYMGSPKTWTPASENLIKEIIKSDFLDRESAIEYESKLISENIDNELNRNYYIPTKGFHTAGNKEIGKKISNALKGRKFSKTHRKNLSLSVTGRVLTDDVKNKISIKSKEWHSKIGFSDKTKEILREKNSGVNNHMYGVLGKEHPSYGKKHTVEVKEKMRKAKIGLYDLGNHPRAKKVRHVDSGKVFDTIVEASNFFNIDRITVSRHCNGKFKKQKFVFV
jgi:hypothetical protein